MFGWSRQIAYRRMFRSLAAVDVTNDDEPVGAVANLVVARIEATGACPPSRRLRTEAAVCRRDGYESRDDEWLGA